MHGTPGEDAPDVVTLHDAGDVVAMVPYLVGYLPAESLVVIGLTGPRQRVGPVLRLDLPPDEDVVASAAQVAEIVAQHRVATVFVLGFSVAVGRAEPAITATVEALGDVGVVVVDAVRADGARWWRVDAARDARYGDPAAGVPYDAGSMRVSAEAVAAGLTHGPDRDASRRVFAPDRETRAEVTTIVDRLRAEPVPIDPADARVAALALVQRGMSDGRLDRVEDLARLGLAVADVACRDILWALMERTTARAHLELWARVARAMPDDLVAGPASLAGFAAWLVGDGTLARHAVDRVLELAPAYSMARLLEEALDRFVDPRSWDSVLAGLRVGS